MIRGKIEPEEFSDIESEESDPIAWKEGWDFWMFTMQTMNNIIWVWKEKF